MLVKKYFHGNDGVQDSLGSIGFEVEKFVRDLPSDESKWHSFVLAFDRGSDGVRDGDCDDVGGDILDAAELLCGGFMPG